jgi:hypothetical protein
MTRSALADQVRGMLGRCQVPGREEDLCAAIGEGFGQKPSRVTCGAGNSDA